MHKFAILVEAGSFTKAAKLLHISQPALSVAIAKMEREHKTKLILSAGRSGIRLSEAGQKVYSAALEHRAVAHNLQLELAEESLEKIPLRIGLIDSVAALLCGQDEPLRTLEEQTELTLSIDHSANLRAAVQSDALDLAVIVASDSEDASIQTVGVGAEQLALVCRSDVASTFEDWLRVGKPLPFISFVQDSVTYSVIQRALLRDTIAVQPVLYSTSTDVMIRMMLRGRAASVLPESLVKDYINTGEVHHICQAGTPYRLQRKMNAVTLKGRRMPPRLSQLALTVRQHLQSYDVEER